MSKLKSPLSLFLISVILIALLALLGPEEKDLGANVRVVYLHGAWVLAAEVAFLAAGVAGLLALFTKRDVLHNWSAALGRTGIVFWVTYLPLSLWAMQTNWTGLFLVEPRFRLALIFAVTGVLLQIGLWLININWVTLLKIDRSFVHHMLEDHQDLAIVEGVIALSRTFGCDVVAEGIETPAQAARLIAQGCCVGQGSGIAAAVPAGRLPGWVSAFRGLPTASA